MRGFNFYKDHRSQWYWQLRDEQDHIVEDSAEDYHQEAACKHGAAVFARDGVAAPEREGQQGSGPAYEYFLDHAGKWRWHFQAANNKIIADSGAKTFPTAADARQGITKVRHLLQSAGGGSAGPPATGGGAYVPPVKPAPGLKNPPYPPTDRPVG